MADAWYPKDDEDQWESWYPKCPACKSKNIKVLDVYRISYELNREIRKMRCGDCKNEFWESEASY